MAKPLKADNVTQLPTRAAKGAGKSKPREPKAKLPPAIPAPKAARSGKKNGAAPQPGATPDTDQSVREALQLKLIGYRQRHRDLDNKMEVLRGELKELATQKKEVRTAIQNAGMPLNLFDEAYRDAGTSRVDLERKENLRAIVREAYGLAHAPQQELLAGVPAAVAPEVYWEAEGYKDGIAGKDPKPPQGCPPENGPHYMKGYDMATARNSLGLKKVEEDGTETSLSPEEAAAAVQRGADQRGEPDAEEEEGEASSSEPADDFEASEAELQAQSGRRAIQERRESELLQ